ncbi:MAG: M14 family metallopeptidase [Fusobacteriaceae bacterium]
MTNFKKLLIGTTSLSIMVFAQTEYTGETFLGKKIITNLDVEDLDSGKVHEFYFQTVENSLGKPWLVPVTVVKGEKTGGKFLINSGVHGNEVNPILTSYKIKEQLAPKNVTGTVTIVHGMNVPGLLNNTRGYKFGGNGESTSDLNRQMDSGKTTNSDQQYSTIIWNNLLSKNADKVIDLHTSGKGSQFPLFVYADFRNPEIEKMAKLTGADVIKMDSGEKGSVETSFVEKGIPAITFELGSAERVQPEIVQRGVQGVLNNLIDFGALAGKVVIKNKTFIGNNWTRLRTERGGYVESKIKLNDTVKKGEVLFVQYDSLGNKIKEYTASSNGVVASLKDYPFAEPGDSLGRVIFYDATDKEQILKK